MATTTFQTGYKTRLNDRTRAQLANSAAARQAQTQAATPSAQTVATPAPVQTQAAATPATPATPAAPATPPRTAVTDPYQMMQYYPVYNQPTTADMTARAQNEAGIKYNSQLSSLARALEQQRLSAQNQTNTVNTAYSTIQDQVDRALRSASDQALKSAIARGGAQSGAVEWLTNKNQEPILMQYAQDEADRANQIAQIAANLALYETQNAGQVSDLTAEQANWQLARQAELEDSALQNALANWTSQFGALQGLAEFDFTKQQAAAENALQQQSIAASRAASSASAAAARRQAELAAQELQMNQALKEAALTGYYNGTPTLDYANQAWSQLMDLANLTGYAYLPGTSTGTLAGSTTGIDTSAALSALSNLLKNYSTT